MHIEGMAPEQIYMAKVIDEDGGWDSNIMRGIEWLIGRRSTSSRAASATRTFPERRRPVGPGLPGRDRPRHHRRGTGEGNDGPGQGTEGSAPDLKSVLAVGATTGWRADSQMSYRVRGNAYKGDQVIT